MTGLDSWLTKATRHLSQDSVVKVTTEIYDHCESARVTAIMSGAMDHEADRLALAALGDPKVANREYRKVLLTSAEARLLRDGNWEARAICSRSWLKWLLGVAPVAAISAAGALFVVGAFGSGKVVLLGGIAMGCFFLGPFLPVYTSSRSRVFRCVKWALLIGTLLVALGPGALKSSWLLTSSLWPLLWIEWTRASIRRKLRTADWPRHLFL
jgi:hypothetical protein